MKKKKKKHARLWGNAQESKTDSSTNESSLDELKANAARHPGGSSPDFDPLTKSEEDDIDDTDGRKNGYPKGGRS